MTLPKFLRSGNIRVAFGEVNVMRVRKGLRFNGKFSPTCHVAIHFCFDHGLIFVGPALRRRLCLLAPHHSTPGVEMRRHFRHNDMFSAFVLLACLLSAHHVVDAHAVPVPVPVPATITTTGNRNPSTGNAGRRRLRRRRRAGSIDNAHTMLDSEDGGNQNHHPAVVR